MLPRALSFVALAAAATSFAAAPAAASPLIVLAPLAAFQAGSACLQPAAPANGRTSKASAILGGGASQLERIAAQQASPALAATPMPAIAAPLRTMTGLCAGPALPLGPVARGAPDDYLGSRRLAVRHTAFDQQWDRVRNGGVAAKFVRQVAAAEPLPGRTNAEAMLQRVNSWTNHHVRYVEDAALYGRADYWAGAQATLAKGAGDCEDIAIAKLALLSALGVPRSDIFLTIARDRVRHADHAMLVVRQGGRYWLLDNGTDRILDASNGMDFQPILSFSSAGKWLHGIAQVGHDAAS